MKHKMIQDLCKIIYDNDPRDRSDHLADTSIHLKDNIYLHICDRKNNFKKEPFFMTLQIIKATYNLSVQFEIIVEDNIQKSLDWIEQNYNLEELQLKLEDNILNAI